MRFVGAQAHHRWSLQDGRKVLASEGDDSYRHRDDRSVLPHYEPRAVSEGFQDKDDAPCVSYPTPGDCGFDRKQI